MSATQKPQATKRIAARRDGPAAALRNSAALELEELEDQRDALVLMLSRVKDANTERFPASLVHALSRGANPTVSYREWRGLSRAELAEAASTTEAMIERIEAGQDIGLHLSVRIAEALRIDPGDLIPWSQD